MLLLSTLSLCFALFMQVQATTNYSVMSYWACLPTKSDQCDLSPLDDYQATALVDVFFVHPTTDSRFGEFPPYYPIVMNQPIDEQIENDDTAEVLKTMVDLFYLFIYFLRKKN